MLCIQEKIGWREEERKKKQGKQAQRGLERKSSFESQLSEGVDDDFELKYDNGTGHYKIEGAQLDNFKRDLEEQTGMKTSRRKMYRINVIPPVRLALERLGVVEKPMVTANAKTTRRDLANLARRQEKEYRDLIAYQRSIEEQLQNKTGEEADRLNEIYEYNREILDRYKIRTRNDKDGLSVFSAVSYQQQYDGGGAYDKLKSVVTGYRDKISNTYAPKSVPVDSPVGKAILRTGESVLYAQDALDGRIYILPSQLEDPETMLPSVATRLTHVSVPHGNFPVQHRYVKSAGELVYVPEDRTRPRISSTYSEE